MAGVRMSWGLSEDEKPINIMDAENGLSCNATCIGCGGRLVAKQGSTTWHFAHHYGEGCSGESIVHFLAKHFLRTEVEKLKIPLHKVSHSEVDMSGMKITEERVLYGHAYSITDVVNELSVSCELRPDCRVYVPELDETIWIEIFYKNRKNDDDIEKIKSHGISCFEIDVSGLSYNTPKEQFVEQVFRGAERRWLNIDREECALYELKEKVSARVLESNRGLLKAAEIFLGYISGNERAWIDQVTWPFIEEKYGESVSRSKPRVTGIHPGWVEKNGHWITNASTEKQGAPVYLVARIRNGQIVRPFAPFDKAVDKPILYIDMSVMRPLTDPHAFSLAWHNTSAWDQALYEMAYKAEVKRVAGIYQYFNWFSSLSVVEQAKVSLAEINVNWSGHLGVVSPFWNSYPATWRGLIIKRYVVDQRLPIVLSVRAIASDPDLKRMLKLSDEEEAREKRQMELHIWLNKLEERKLVAREDGRRYRLSRLPRHLSELVAQY